MNLETYRHYCLQKPGTTESFPFDEYTIVYKVGGKMFTLANIQTFEHINVKCDPQKALILRDQYIGVIPGWHMNKKHWNSLKLNQDLNDHFICQCIDDSYELIVKSLPRKVQKSLRFT